MKKMTIIYSVVLVALVCTLVACSSDKKDKDTISAKKSGTTTTTFPRDLKAEAKFDADLALMKANFAKSCQEIQGDYNDYRSAGTYDDGFIDLTHLQFAFSSAGVDMYAGANYNEWPTYGKYKTFYEDKVVPFQTKLDSYTIQMDSLTESAITESQTSDQLKVIDVIVADFNSTVSDAPFGDCELG